MSNNNQLVPGGVTLPASTVLLADVANKDEKYRLGTFARWLDEKGHYWFSPPLDEYMKHMVKSEFKASTIQTHLSTIRTKYARLLLDRDRFLSMAPTDLDFVTRKAIADEIETRLERLIDPKRFKVRVTKTDGQEDSQHLRLTADQVEELLSAVDRNTLPGLRTLAMFSLALCTGLREGELVSLKVADLRVEAHSGLKCLRIVEGKGMKTRFVPYGSLDWCLDIVDRWLEVAQIETGYVFPRLYRGSKVSNKPLTTRAVQLEINRYPVTDAFGNKIEVHFHDLRRTYARRLYDAGVDLVVIQQNLGHADLKTTMRYIGILDEQTRAPMVLPYTFTLT